MRDACSAALVTEPVSVPGDQLSSLAPLSPLVGRGPGKHNPISPSLLIEYDRRTLSSGRTNHTVCSKSRCKLAQDPPVLGHLLS